MNNSGNQSGASAAPAAIPTKPIVLPDSAPLGAGLANSAKKGLISIRDRNKKALQIGD